VAGRVPGETGRASVPTHVKAEPRRATSSRPYASATRDAASRPKVCSSSTARILAARAERYGFIEHASALEGERFMQAWKHARPRCPTRSGPEEAHGGSPTWRSRRQGAAANLRARRGQPVRQPRPAAAARACLLGASRLVARGSRSLSTALDASPRRPRPARRSPPPRTRRTSPPRH
jgi:hypothetical protein